MWRNLGGGQSNYTKNQRRNTNSLFGWKNLSRTICPAFLFERQRSWNHENHIKSRFLGKIPQIHEHIIHVWAGERLAYVSKKSHTRAEIPLSPGVERIIEDNEANDLTGEEVSDVTFNKTIRVICKNVGIDERVKLYQAGRYIGGEKWAFISSHTARRSFATNLYLRGADLYLISKLMGHSSVSMTEGYIVCGLRELPEKVLQYFQTFK